MTKPDIIIVGAGSAGCMMAHRLAKETGLRITLIEPRSDQANIKDREQPYRWLNLLGSGEDWGFETAKNELLAGRTLGWPRGRGLGGCGRINAMIWFSPTERDFESLARAVGDPPSVLRESFSQVEAIVRPEMPTWVSEAAKQFVSATMGIDRNGFLFRRVNRNGRRWNPSELIDRQRINVVRGTVDRLQIESDQVTGVVMSGGEVINCDRSVVLCAGTIASPMILMRSGYGPKELLLEHDVDVVRDAPTVGAGLSDHLIMPVVFGVDDRLRFHPTASDFDELSWQQTGSGPIASNIAEAGGLFDGDRIQVHVTPTHYLTFPSEKSVSAMTLGVNVTQPKSRGRITISSKDPAAQPVIQPNYFVDESDLELTISSVRFARQIAKRDPLCDFVGDELLPGPKRESDQAIAKSIQRFAQTLYHPTSTLSNVDLSIGGLDVVDASILPHVTVGNPNASVMTLAYHVAGQIIESI